jgi:hypothetical protein
MSGQPYKTKLDMVTTRKAYLANLNLRAELDDKNLQANKTYIRTGQLPVEPTDTRTLTEKLGDVQRLKIDLRNQLLDITDGLEANAIVQSLNSDQLIFLSQNFGPISEQMKQNYSLGVLAPIFVDYLNRYISKFNETKGVEFNLQQSTGNKLLAGQSIIMNEMANVSDIIKLEDLITELGQQNTRLGKSIFRNLNELEDVVSNLPDTFVSLQNADNSIQKAEILTLLNNIVKELPDKSDLANITKELAQIKKSDIASIISLLERLDSLTKSGVDVSQEMEILRTSIQIQQKQINFLETVPLGAKTGLEIKDNYKSVDKIISEKKADESLQKILRDYFKKMYGYLNNNKTKGAYSIEKIESSNYGSASIPKLKQLVEALNTDLRIKMYGEDSTQLVQYFGRGLTKRRIRTSQVFESGIDYSKGIKASPKFIPIGRYLINSRQLDNDIIAIKRPAGSPIIGLPSQRVTKNTANIIRKILGGSIPNYNDLNTLTDEERLFLSRVVKETRIDDKISIPSPNKTDDDKDINQFEILRGQILAGNDNKDLVKNFKIILLKLSKKELIPKTQVKDLLLDMATLGH